MAMSPTSRRAFTLIELLVVIAIISLLVSILMPSLSKAKELARTSVCATQMRTMMLATMMYTEDNNQRWPGLVFEPIPDPNDPSKTVWAQAWNLFSGATGPRGHCPGLVKDKWVEPEQTHCPSGDAKKRRLNISYTANMYIWFNPNLMEPFGRRAFRTNIPQPDKTLLIVEEEEASIANEQFAVRTDEWWRMVSGRHRGANMSFTDLHVEFWKWQWPSTGVFIAHNTFDYGNPDLDRINRAMCPPAVP
ncbi:MAG: type II secretion system GspH family protein [Phycisphaerae bacterium]|nr:type II secretion system GspH family protein [Phycisphaerae bacterium]